MSPKGWYDEVNLYVLVYKHLQGHSPAGGCLLALCCDYRIMAPNYSIGLNETQLVSQFNSKGVLLY